MNKRLSSHSATMDLVKKHGFKFTKSLGQNFLIDDNIVDKIVAGAGIGPGDKIIEVGPGIGTLTREMASRAQNLMAVEIDKNLIPILEDTLGDYDNVKIVNEDNNTETIKPFFVDDIAVTKERDMAYAKKDEDIQFEYVEELL